MADEFEEIPLREAMTTLRLDRHFHNNTTPDQYRTADDLIAEVEADPARLRRFEAKNPDWRADWRRRYPLQFVVRHYSNHAVVNGDLDMDHDLLAREVAVAGIVVDGDLELHGAIMNWEIDTIATFLWVRGNLHCTNIVAGCMHLVVDGNVTAGNLIVASYNHGHFHIGGDVHARRVISDDDGARVIKGKVFAQGWNSSQNAEVDLRESEWIKEIRPEFRDEFFNADGDMRCGNGNVDLVKALLAGREILRER